MSDVTERFRAARDQLIELREDLDAARDSFSWPHFEHFNFALDWFDVVADGNDEPALHIVEEDGSQRTWSYSDLSLRSNRVANLLAASGVRRGSHVMIMLGNRVELWESMLACTKLGAVMLPTAVQLGPVDLHDRAERGEVDFAIVGAADAAKFNSVEAPLTRIVVGAPAQRPGDVAYAAAAEQSAAFTPDGPTAADDPLLLYFTSGTTSKAKMVVHTHVSYPVGHLATLYWMGLEPGDVHLNIASPGWAKHAWSNIFTPWIAGACVFVYNYSRFDAAALMRVMDTVGVTSFCAPPTVWRMLVQEGLENLSAPPAKALSAGEPLNPDVIARVERDWHTTVRDGYGQTETVLVIGNTPGQDTAPGTMGRALPGFDVVLRDPATGEMTDEGEICLRLDPRPVGLTTGYWHDEARTDAVFADDVYHTGDVAARDETGCFTYVGRADDVFKASDYRLSPFELESVLIEHEAVLEAAVVPSPDPVRLAVPKAYVVLAPGWEPNAGTAEDILRFCREELPPYKRIRRLEFTELPKTMSGKIRRVELRVRERELHGVGGEIEDRVPGVDPAGTAGASGPSWGDGASREWSEADFAEPLS